MTQEVETTTGPERQPDIVITPHAVVGEHSHSDTVAVPFLGTVTVPGGIYTVIFGGLGALTILEVILASLIELLKIDVPLIKVILLLGLAVVKALLVVMFYMHLRQDNRVFRLILGLPLLIVVLGVLYLLSVPHSGGMGYPAATITYTPSATVPATATSPATATPLVEATSEATGEATSEATLEAAPDASAATSEPEAAVTFEAPSSEATAEATAES